MDTSSARQGTTTTNSAGYSDGSGMYMTDATGNAYVYSTPVMTYYEDPYHVTANGAYVLQDSSGNYANISNNSPAGNNNNGVAEQQITQLLKELENARLQLRSLLQERQTQQEIMKKEEERTRMLEDELNVAITEIARLTQVNDEMEKLINNQLNLQ